MKSEDKEVLQQVLDCLAYVKGYKEKLIEFNQQFDPNKQGVKFTHDVSKFMFSIDVAI